MIRVNGGALFSFSLYLVLCFSVILPVLCDFPATFQLEKVAPNVDSLELEGLRARDRARHGRLLQNVVDFPVNGSYDPFTFGLYFTKVQLGNPPKEFYVQIDTGSDILWVTCASCRGCPNTSGLGITLEFFNPQQSSTASMMSCTNPKCIAATRSSEAGCSSKSSCDYSFQYGDGSGTNGHYVSDTMHFQTVVGDDSTSNSSASVIFGCSDSQTGGLTKSDRAVDGILGLGQSDLSIISQLSSQGVAPKVFSHCLRAGGGGILVLGEIVEPGIVYTPIIQSLPHYNLNLQSISVNGQTLSIDSSVFATSSTQGTIIDSGTTLAYLADEAYDPFVNAIAAAVSQSARTVPVKDNQCFVAASSLDGIFPTVTLNFQGASMKLNPEDYLIQQGSVDNAIIWCIGWQKNQGQSLTILGDLVLKDKILVYDLENQRIGWTNFNCGSPVNVSSSSHKNEFINAGQLSKNGSPSLVTINPLVCLGHLLLSLSFLHLCTKILII
ncbi:aspartic proteinase-like protein 2 [Amborella trichopoda]|uniref:aspartic proteinase-like protein 2 n=1 Tax=Amborella trichopoda TaxID=13333 RepID=UPI0005D45286|nr:aspartic proteinase-like protein 2 [Amborella trichopoda]|eukprot:XP_011621574.1 aspartic proteinase-like protein 2 [Amborella trichopoda]